MNFVLWIVAIVLVALVASYVGAGLLLKPLDEEVRAGLVTSGEAHQFADLPGGVTHFRLEGPQGTARAPLIVLVHGFSTPSFVYDDYFEPLTSAGFRVLTFDLFGRGFSDRPDGSYGVGRYVSQLDQLLDHLGQSEPVHLVGYSMGGPIVTQFANDHRARVASISLIAPAGLATPEGQDSPLMLRPLIGEWVFRVLGSSVMQKRLSDGFDDYAPDPEGFAADFGRQFAYRGLDHALLDTIRAFGRGEFEVNFSGPPQAGIPVQAFFAEDDSVIPIVSADRLAVINSQAAIHRFSDGDHAIGYGKVDEIAAGIAAFVSEQSAELSTKQSIEQASE